MKLDHIIEWEEGSKPITTSDKAFERIEKIFPRPKDEELYDLWFETVYPLVEKEHEKVIKEYFPNTRKKWSDEDILHMVGGPRPSSNREWIINVAVPLGRSWQSCKKKYQDIMKKSKKSAEKEVSHEPLGSIDMGITHDSVVITLEKDDPKTPLIMSIIQSVIHLGEWKE
jgi:hypothetical protein